MPLRSVSRFVYFFFRHAPLHRRAHEVGRVGSVPLGLWFSQARNGCKDLWIYVVVLDYGNEIGYEGGEGQ